MAEPGPVGSSDHALVHRMRLDEPWFRAMLQGRKRIELRVFDTKRSRVRAGDAIVFTCNGAELTVRVAAVRKYADFAELYAHENAAAINPEMSVDDQLRGVRAIYPPEKEALGVLAIEIAPLA